MKALEDLVQNTKEGFYWLGAFCTNCGLEKHLAFRRSYSVSQHECPNCENRTLEKKHL